MSHTTGIYLKDSHRNKLREVAEALQCSQNRAIQIMIEAATVVKPKLPVEVQLKTNGAEPSQKSGAILR